MVETTETGTVVPGQEDKGPPVKEGPPVQLPPGFEHMCLFETASTRWNVSVPINIPREKLLDPGFWAHHAMGKRPGDEIRALAQDGTWIAEYFVIDTHATWLKVKEKGFWALSGEEGAENELVVRAFIGDHRVAHRGPRKWSIVRSADGAVLQQDITEQDAAYAWLNKHAREQVGGSIRAA